MRMNRDIIPKHYTPHQYEATDISLKGSLCGKVEALQ